MRRTLTALGLAGAFLVVPAASASAAQVNGVTGKPGLSLGNCGITAANVTSLAADVIVAEGSGYGGRLNDVCLRGKPASTPPVVQAPPADLPPPT